MDRDGARFSSPLIGYRVVVNVAVYRYVLVQEGRDDSHVLLSEPAFDLVMTYIFDIKRLGSVFWGDSG